MTDAADDVTDVAGDDDPGPNDSAPAGPHDAVTRGLVEMGSGAEFDLIRGLLAKTNAVAGDDAAVIDGGRLVMSTDLSVEDVHFRRSWVTFAEAGARAVTAAASDLAAMAAAPVAVLISLAVAPGEAPTVMSGLGDGIDAALKRLGAPLVGGDLAASPGPVVIDVTVVGEVEEPVTRSGARPGDELWVTGVLGGSAGAVRSWIDGTEPGPGLRESFVRPTARIDEARWLAEQAQLRAMIDLSDGLAGDAGHLAAASGVRIVLDARLVPLHPDLSADASSLAMSGGEDYELCFVSPPGVTAPLADEFRERFGIGLTRVGHVAEGAGVEIVGAVEGRDHVSGGFDHFSSREGSC